MKQAQGAAQLIDQHSLRWIFVGGKGGVGKTTTSTSLAIYIAERNHRMGEKTLIMSTDPAHSLSDALSQQLTAEATAVNAVPGLFALEVSPYTKFRQEEDSELPYNELMQYISQMFKTSSIPGMDEIMSFMEVMKIASDNYYKTVIFDTAPTGHTLRFLEIPQMAQGMRGIVNTIKSTLGGVIAMMGAGNSQEAFASIDNVFVKCQEIQEQFSNPDLTQFVCVCIPEFLSLYETERLVQHLARLGIDCSTIVCNQVLDVGDACACGFCAARHRMQMKYISQMQQLYEDFCLIFMQQKDREMRGIADLRLFGTELLTGKQFSWM